MTRQKYSIVDLRNPDGTEGILSLYHLTEIFDALNENGAVLVTGAARGSSSIFQMGLIMMAEYEKQRGQKL